MKTRTAKILMIVFLVLGLLILAAGIIVPIIILNSINDNLDNLWMSPDSYETWGVTPGKSDSKVVTSYKIFNYTNPEEIFLGAKPVLVELPEKPFQEHTKYKNWYYTDENGNNFGQEDGTDLVAYNYQLDYVPLKNNGTYIDENTPVTSFNVPLYLTFLGLTNNQPPLYVVPNLYDVVMAFENDLPDMVIAYGIYKNYLQNSSRVEETLEKNDGLEKTLAERLVGDDTYGWGSWKSLRKWVTSIFEYRNTKSIWNGAFENIMDYFDNVDELKGLLHDNSTFSNWVDEAISDIKTSCNISTFDRSKLASIQWSTALVTRNLPFGLGPFNGTETAPFPSFLAMNETFNFLPEIPFLLKYLRLPEADYTQEASKLLEYCLTYPKNNTQSMLNISNIASFFINWLSGNYQKLEHDYDLNETQSMGLFYYLGSLANLPIEWEGNYRMTDGYSMMLSRWTRRSIVTETNHLRNDAVWGLYSKMLYCNYKNESLGCEDLVGVNGTKVCSDPTIGWSITDPDTWTNLEVWIKASKKGPDSLEYQKIYNTGYLSKQTLTETLEKISNATSGIEKAVAEFYGCLGRCTYDELFFMQWGMSSLTLNLPDNLTQCGVKPSKTMKDWYKSRYQVPIEWTYYSEIELSPFLGEQFINYEAFLNPTPLRLFYNYYFLGNLTKTAEFFGLPNIDLVPMLYNYFTKIIPGFSFFVTAPYRESIVNRIDPFLGFVHNLNFYEGGYIAANPNTTLVSPTRDTKDTPPDVMHTGKSDSSDTRLYYKYYGSEILNMYSKSLNPYVEGGLSYQYFDIWAENITLKGTDGGYFGPRVDQEDELKVFISSILRYGSIVYKDKTKYDDLDVYHFVLDPEDLKTEEEVPENAKFYQLKNGFNGFMNITEQIGGPFFLSLPRCLYCDEKAKEMVEYYAYSNSSDSYLSTRIYPHQSDGDSYAEIEPLTGVSVGLMLQLQTYTGIYRDYFFKNIYETVPGKGLYMPYYTLRRSSNYTQSQIDDTFKTLKLALAAKKWVFFSGIIGGSAFILASIMLGIYIYRKRKFGGWKSPRTSKDFSEEPLTKEAY